MSANDAHPVPDYKAKILRMPCGCRIDRSQPGVPFEAPILHISGCNKCRDPHAMAMFLAAVHAETDGDEKADEKVRVGFLHIAQRAEEHPRIKRLQEAVRAAVALPDSILRRIQMQLMFLMSAKDIGAEIRAYLAQVAPKAPTGLVEALATWALYIVDEVVPKSRPNVEFPDGSNGKLTTFRPYVWANGGRGMQARVLWYADHVQIPGIAQGTLLRVLCEYLKKACELTPAQLFLADAHTFGKCVFGSQGSVQVRLTTIERADVDHAVDKFFERVTDIADCADRLQKSFQKLSDAQFLPRLRGDFLAQVETFDTELKSLYREPKEGEDEYQDRPATIGYTGLAVFQAIANALKRDASLEELRRLCAKSQDAISRFNRDNMMQYSLVFLPQCDSLADMSVTLAPVGCKESIDLGSSCLPLAATVDGDLEQLRREEVGSMWQEAVEEVQRELWDEASGAADREKAQADAEAERKAIVLVTNEKKDIAAQSARFASYDPAPMLRRLETKEYLQEVKSRLLAPVKIKKIVDYTRAVSKQRLRACINKKFALTRYLEVDKLLSDFQKGRVEKGAELVPLHKDDVKARDGLQEMQLALAEEIGSRLALHKEKGKYDCALVKEVCQRYSMLTRNIVTLPLPLDGKAIKRTRKVAASEAPSKQLKDVSKLQFSVTLCAGYKNRPRYIFRMPFAAFGPRAQPEGVARVLQYTIDTLNALVVAT